MNLLNSKKWLRRWAAWMVCSVWAGTLLMVLIAWRTHPSTTANILLNTGKISFRTNANRILGPGDEEQVLISGINSLRIQFNSPQTVTIGKASSSVDSLEIVGESSAYCSFYQVRSGVLELIGPSILTLGTSNTMAGQPFSLTAHG